MEIFVARQPIFNKKMEVYGYELLYRSNAEKNLYDNFDGNKASSDVIAASFLVMGLDIYKSPDGQHDEINCISTNMC